MTKLKNRWRSANIPIDLKAQKIIADPMRHAATIAVSARLVLISDAKYALNSRIGTRMRDIPSNPAWLKRS